MYSKLITHLEELIEKIHKINQFEFNKNPIEDFGCSYDRLEFNQLGCDLFDKLFDIGQIIGEYQATSLTDQPQFSIEINQLFCKSIELIVKPISYNICLFLDTYPVACIESTAAGDSFSENWCVIRSGFQYLLDLYRNVEISSYYGDSGATINAGLDKLKSYQSTFDRYLKDWQTTAYDINESQIPKYLPESHWWWFKKFY